MICKFNQKLSGVRETVNLKSRELKIIYEEWNCPRLQWATLELGSSWNRLPTVAEIEEIFARKAPWVQVREILQVSLKKRKYEAI